MKQVEDWSLAYDILRQVGKFIQSIAHRKVTTIGLENIPKNEPAIIAPNHQNALSDSLAILLNTNMQPVFLGRADMFKKKRVANILGFFKISPVYRLRDGKETLDKNQEVYDNCVRILKLNKKLCIYPEAAHNAMKSMLPHKKAIPRIAFLAAEETNFEINVKVVPVGIYYSHYFNFRRELFVNFGKPLNSKDYYQLYKEQGEAKATLAFKIDLHDAIDKLSVNVTDKQSYDLYEAAFETSRNLAFKKLELTTDLKNKVTAEKYITNKIKENIDENPELKEELVKKAQIYKRLKNSFQITELELTKGEVGLAKAVLNFIFALLLLPLGAYGAVANGWLFYITRFSYRKKVKDKHFYSTISFGLSFILFPIWYIAQFFILFAIFHNWLYALGIIILSVPSGLIAWQIWILLKQTTIRLKMRKQHKSKNKRYLQLLELRTELSVFFAKII